VGEPGAILDGGDVTDRGIFGYGGTNGQHHVTIANLIFEDFTVEAVKAGVDWTIVDSEIRSSRVGVRVGSGSVLRRTWIHHNAIYGIVGGPSTDVLIEGNELAFNGGTDDAGGSSGGSKIAGSSAGASHIVWRNNHVHHNIGPGIWSDGNVRFVLYEGNLVEENRGPGIFHEISWDATIRDNVARGNATNAIGRSCWWGSQIHVNTSQNVDIVDNIVRTESGANGICLVDANRPQVSPFPTDLANIDVRGNWITLGGTANAGLVGQAAMGITFDENAYAVPTTTGTYWAWFDGYPITWAEFRARAGEANGILTATVSGPQI
jgi:parallel beta-helix repeat protein